MNFDKIPNNREGMSMLSDYLQHYMHDYRSLPRILSFSVERDTGLTMSFGGGRIYSPSEQYIIDPLSPMQYSEMLYLLAKGVEYDRKGDSRKVEYVEVDKSEALYASIVKRLEDRHRAILEAVNDMINSEIPRDQANALEKMREWRESLKEESKEALTEEEPRFKLLPELEL